MGKDMVRRIANDPVAWTKLLVGVVCITATVVAWAHVKISGLQEQINENKLNNAVIATKLEALEKGQEEIKRLVRK